MRMIILLVLLLVSCSVASPALADNSKQASSKSASKASTQEDKQIDPAKRALAKRLMIASGFDDKHCATILNTLMKGIVNVGEAASKSSTMDSKVKKRDARISKALKQVFTEDIDMMQVLTEIYANIYAREFTEDELKALTKFYESETGKKWINLMPQLSKDGGFYGRTVLGPKIDAALNAAITEECDMKLFKNQTTKTQ